MLVHPNAERVRQRRQLAAAEMVERFLPDELWALFLPVVVLDPTRRRAGVGAAKGSARCRRR
ncbi:hypothetical protein GCM10023178_16880 [Actinomadura luteofluorescens]